MIGEGFAEGALTEAQIQRIVETALAALDLRARRVLLIVPDLTRTAPIGTLFRLIHQRIGPQTAALDVMFALGTHPPMTEAAMRERLEITEAERNGVYARVRLLNHAWDDPAELVSLGTISAEEISELSEGRLSQTVEVTVNRAVREYDQLLIAGPVFPHEVVGFSGGDKYLFPGISGAEILNFFHWLGALITNPGIIGREETAVRRVIHRAADLIPTPRFAFCLVVNETGLAGLFAGTPAAAWKQAADLSRRVHILYKPHPFHTVLSGAPPMYDELWVAGKCLYKLEPVVEDGGELIIYAPHLSEISLTHGKTILRIGYHIRDYFLEDWERYKDEPWGVLAHSTHVRGIGRMENGVEKPRIKVTLATRIPEAVCRQINLGYRDPDTIRPEDYAGREAEGVLFVPKAGERLYRLRNQN